MIIDFIFFVGGKSGFELALNRTADYLSKHCHTVRFFQLKKTGINWATKNALFTCFNFGSDINIEISSKYYAEYIYNHNIPDVIIASGMPAIIYVAKKALIKLSISTCPIICWPHSDIYFYDDDVNNTINAIKLSDIIFSMSDKIADTIEDHGVNKVLYRVNNTIEIKNLVYSKSRKSNKFAYVGRLSKEKNIPLILKSLALVKHNISLTIIGDGPEKDTLCQLCDTLGITDRVFFTGWVDNPWAITSEYRGLIFSSCDSIEGSPLTCIEALSCGLPVISTPVATIPEIISHGVNGYIYPFDDPDALSDILDKIVTEDFNPSTSEACRQSVADFMPEVALWDFMCKTIASSRLIGLPQRNWKDKDKRLIKSKASVLISNVGISDSFFIKQLNSLCKQSIEPRYYEIVIIYSKSSEDTASRVHDYESIHPDNIILIELTETSIDKKEAYEIGLTYASGDMLFSLENIDYILSSHQVENWYMDKICSL
ncbi:MAG: glycosyltransferase [Butyrivibrio sp.]|uniref:glycosyltransferase n=1 Tax=Butyrivibrio sp. TaxID=28121 RepID=UPI001B01FC16|nr:glycosyltransferase [Butyrivibrio sp.]MBO6241703.1 glycosyltransferase [Butyrivibrio sp.]